MNKVILIGRACSNPKMTAISGQEPISVARVTIAVDRFKKGQKTADFIPLVAFGKQADWFDKYVKQGTKIAIVGNIETGSYTNKDGAKVYTTDVNVENAEFAESKAASGQPDVTVPIETSDDGFVKVPDNLDEDGLPF